MAATGLDYWTERATRYGTRAAINLEHPDGALDTVSADHRARLMPLLAARLRGDERLVLDLGCGPGRLTGALAATVGGHAVGADPVRAMLALAPEAPATSYGLIRDGRLPLADGRADVVFTCLVLGGVADADLPATAAEVRRVLAPGGLVFLCESLSEDPAHAHWQPRSAGEYRAAFPWAALEDVATFADGDDTVGVLAGRG